MKNIFIDCNIIIDWLTGREPFSEYAKALIIEIENKKMTAFVSPLILSNVYYILSKTYNKQVAYSFIEDSLKVFKVCDVLGFDVFQSLKNKFKDFEDDLHFFTEKRNKIKIIITRNKNDFINENIEVMSAEEFLENERDSKKSIPK